MPEKIGGLTFKKVVHTVDRPCMWYSDPHDKPEWRLVKNKWRRSEETHFKSEAAWASMFNNDEEKSTKRKMRSARRKQFFTFLEGFFEKSNLESIKL